MGSEYETTNFLLGDHPYSIDSFSNNSNGDNVILTTLVTSDIVNGSNPDHNTRPLMCVNIPVKIVSSNANLDTSQCSLQLTSVVPEFTSVPIQNDVSHSITDNVLSALTKSSQVVVLPDDHISSNQDDDADKCVEHCNVFTTTLNHIPDKLIGTSVNRENEDTIQSRDVTDNETPPSELPKLPSSYLNIDTSGFDTLYICKLCDEKFRTLKRFKVHFSVHMNAKYFKCDQCNMSFNKKINFVLHSSTHVTEGDFQCPSCQKIFRRLASFKSHIKIHEEEDVLVCNVCDEEFTNMICLNFHLNEQHVDDKSKLRYVCNTCTEFFDNYPNYKAHMNNHVQMKKLFENYYRNRKSKSNYTCHVCDKSFAMRSQLTRHYRIHTGEKPYKCQVCDYAFNQKSSLTTHMFQHDGKRPYTCRLCPCTFTQKGNLKSHVSKVHTLHEPNETTYKCEQCSCVFRTSNNLKLHINRVHTQKTTVDSEASTNTLCDNMEYLLQGDQMSIFDTSTSDIDFSLLETYQESNDNISDCNEIERENGNDDDIERLFSDLTPLPVESLDSYMFPSPDDLIPCEDSVEPEEVHEDQITSSNNSNTFYKCVVCGNVFNDEHELSTHQKENPSCCVNVVISEAHNSLIYRCKCNLTFNSSRTFSMHVRAHNSQKTPLCLCCEKQFKTKIAFEEHFMKHAQKGQFPCKYCGEMNDNEITLKHHVSDVHLRTVNEGRANRATCVVLTREQRKYLASVNLDNTASVSQHVLRDLLKKNNENVKKCDDIFDDLNSDDVDNDEQEIGNRHVANVDDKTCEYCDKRFRKMSDLERHIRIHTGEKPYVCKFCDKAFSLLSTLNDHLKTHTTLKDVSCHVCGRFFANKSALTTHMRLHTGDMPYQCMYCDKKYRTSYHRNIHELNHFKQDADRRSGNRYNFNSRHIQFEAASNKPIIRKRNGKLIYYCRLCQKMSDKRDAAVSHAEAHKAIKLYKCDVCSAEFNCKMTYVNHGKLCRWSCNLCKMHFASEDHLTSHVDSAHNVIKPVIDEIINSAHDITFDDNLYIGAIDDLDSVIDDIFVP